MLAARRRGYAYLHSDECDDGGRKDRDQGQTGQEVSKSVCLLSSFRGGCRAMGIELVLPPFILGSYRAPPREFESLSAP